MVESQYEPASQQRCFCEARCGILLQRHPVLTPVFLLGCALFLAVVSIFADTFFPLLVFVGISPTHYCLSLALVLWIAGVLTGIISILECFNRYSIRAAMFAKAKEQNYANRN